MKLLLTMIAALASAAALAGCRGGTQRPTPTASPATIVASTPTPSLTERQIVLTQTAGLLPCQNGQGGPRLTTELGSQRWVLCSGGTENGVEYKWIYRSDDMGTTWHVLADRPSTVRSAFTPVVASAAPPGFVTAFVMNTSLDGWIGTRGPGADLWRTRDGGATWAPVTLIADGETVRTIDFSDADDATMHTAAGLWTTADGGDHWLETAPTPAITATPNPAGESGCPTTGYVPTQQVPRMSVFRLDARHCWMIWNLGASGGTVQSQQLFRSDDGGQTWILLAEGGFSSVLAQPISDYGDLPGSGIDVLLFLTTEIGWMGTDEPGATLWSTHDGGNTWTPAAIQIATNVTSIVCSNLDTCTVTTALGKWVTHDGGATWVPAS